MAALTAGALTPVPLPISPWRQRALLRPKPQTLRSRALLQRLQLGMLLGVGRVDPGHACGDLGGPHIFTRTLHIGHGAAVIIPGQRLQPGLLPKAQLRQVLF